MTASAEVQKAVYLLLVAASITGVTEVRDKPIRKPSDSDFPFIEIGASQVVAADAGGDTGIEEFIDIHCYSRSGGQKEIKQIMGAIYAALHHQSLTVSGRDTAFCWFDDGRTLGDPDGLTRHGVQTFRITHRS